MGWLKLVGFLLVLHTAEAAEIDHVSVMYKQGVYSIEVDVAINAEFKKVRTIIDDYDRLDRISTVIIDSSLIGHPEAELIRRRLIAKTCILYFCFKVTAVGDIQEFAAHSESLFQYFLSNRCTPSVVLGWKGVSSKDNGVEACLQSCGNGRKNNYRDCEQAKGKALLCRSVFSSLW